MGIFDNDYDLPGVFTEVEPDYSYGYDTSLFGTTDSVVVIGTAFNGPVGQVTPIYSKDHASYIFGKVYDSTKQQEASLVAGINDAWDRGCRTIYACRVGGKDLYKDFNLRVEHGLKLRVSSRFPTNEGKECYLRFDNTSGDETVVLYKPADRATINEKRAGLSATDESVISVKLRVNTDYGLTKDSRLSDLIDLVNSNTYNNVLTLGIVNQDGKDVTTSDEARKLPIGVLYPGVYFVGRDHSACTEETNVQFSLVKETVENGVVTSNKPYTNCKDLYFRTLKLNTDVSQPYPIFGSAKELQKILKTANITVNASIDRDTMQSHMWDWLKSAELSDRAFVPNDEDYEEANLSGFDLYQRLGCGFATTAMAEKRVKSHEITLSNGEKKTIIDEVLRPRIKETPLDNKHHTIQIPDGIYAVLQDANVKYRALVCAPADGETSGKLPRADEFKTTTAQSVDILGDRFVLSSRVEADDRSDAKEYAISFEDVKETDFATVNDIYQDTVYDLIAALPTKEADGKTDFDLKNHKVASGSMFMQFDANGKGTLFRVTSAVEKLTGLDLEGKRFIVADQKTVKGTPAVKDALGNITTPATPDKVVNTYRFVQGVVAGANKDYVEFEDVALTGGKFNGKTYVLGNSVNNIMVYKVLADGLEPEGDLTGMMTKDQDKPVIYAESLYFHRNMVVVRSAAFENTTLEELGDLLNDDDVFGSLFTVTLDEEGSLNKDDFVADVCKNKELDPNTYYELAVDRVTDYDYGMYIPYKTTDNFVRQLAQHCTYTELKTCPTWGFIGQSRMGATDLTSVSKEVSDLLEVDYDLYAKNAYGRNMLDRSGLPYPIGKNVSVCFMQYSTPIETESYTFISNGAAGYAGMVSALPLDQSSTAQPFDISQIPFSLTQSQLGKLTAKGIVTLRNSFTKGVTVTDGVTMAPVESVFRRLAASRVVGAVEELIRRAAEPFIGKQNSVANRNALHTAIKSNLDKILGVLIENYEFKLIADQKVAKFSYIDINYSIVPVYEIREVRNHISVKDSLAS